MTGYRKCEGNTTMSFKISDKQFFQKYNQIWKRVERCLLIVMLDSVIKAKKKYYPQIQ